MNRSERIFARLSTPFPEPWLLRYTCLAAVGLLCILAGFTLKVGWLFLAGAALCIPFGMWVSVFLGVVLPLALAWRLTRAH